MPRKAMRRRRRRRRTRRRGAPGQGGHLNFAEPSLGPLTPLLSLQRRLSIISHFVHLLAALLLSVLFFVLHALSPRLVSIVLLSPLPLPPLSSCSSSIIQLSLWSSEIFCCGRLVQSNVIAFFPWS